MTKIAIIPARGGSKRIPRKNTRIFFGKPVISYTIEKLIESQLFDEIMVSTEDEEIAEIALNYGAKVPFLRSQKTANDYASTSDVLIEVLENYAKKGLNFRWGCCIYPLNPLLDNSLLDSAFKKMLKMGKKCIFSAIKFSHPIERAFQIKSNETIEFISPKNFLLRTQDFNNYFHDAGQFYWFEINKFLSSRQLIMQESTVFELNPLQAHDVDNEIDWQLMELKYKYQQKIN